jgi:predicted nucleotidyltransferase component of viral defense system
MFPSILSKNAKQALAVLGKQKFFRSMYLAGGTGLSLQIGHRYSYDFDFFTPQAFREQILIQRLSNILPDFRVERQEWRTILGYIRDTRFTLFFYKYPLLFSPQLFEGIHVAHLKDIAAMKIAALADRGIKKDFIDLYFLIYKEKVLTLSEALELYDKKYGVLAQNKLTIIKSLGYFDDAETSEMPRMIQKVSWRAVKKFFLQEQKWIAKKFF